MRDYTHRNEFIMAKQVILTTQEVAKRLLTTLEQIQAAYDDGCPSVSKTAWAKTKYDSVGRDMWVEVPMTDAE